jgi:PRC-barrel domain
MADKQFENSRVSEATETDISNMIAEGGPASADGMRVVVRGTCAASTLLGRRVLSAARDEMGNIEEIMLDLVSGRIAYAVLSFSGFPGIANKRFPVPWSALRLDQSDFILDIDKKTFEGAPDFEKDNWPDMSDPAFSRAVHKHYGQQPYWEESILHAGVPLRGVGEPTSDGQAEMRH